MTPAIEFFKIFFTAAFTVRLNNISQSIISLKLKRRIPEKKTGECFIFR